MNFGEDYLILTHWIDTLQNQTNFKIRFFKFVDGFVDFRIFFCFRTYGNSPLFLFRDAKSKQVLNTKKNDNHEYAVLLRKFSLFQ